MRLLGDVDYAFVGEAERGVGQFFSREKGSLAAEEADLSAFNLVFRRNGSVVTNPRHSFEDLDELPFPAWHLMDPRRYPLVPHGVFCRQRPIAPMIISRGCPFPCAFCAGKTVTGTTVRYRSVANALEEILLLRDSYGVREVRIEDDNFALRKDYVHSFCEAVLSRSPGLSFALPNGVRLDSLDAPTLRLMERAGFYSMAVGIESGSDRVLAMMKKQITSEEIREKVCLIKSATRILLTGFFVFGFPGETAQDIEETISFARSLPLDAASFMFLMPLPGSELWEDFRAKSGPVDWDAFFYYRIVEGLSDIPTPLLKRLRKRAVVSFYGRPRILWGLASRIRSLDQAAILAKRVAAAFLCS
jgi:radical SAM superfamily enzyme YgiQ (UPF0313 family)